LAAGAKRGSVDAFLNENTAEASGRLPTRLEEAVKRLAAGGGDVDVVDVPGR
jgi:hypothetical protein